MSNSTSQKPKIPKRNVHKTTYIGISRKETDFLLALSSEDVKTYIAFKWLADFSTGFVGTDPKRYMTLERLAESARTSTSRLVQQITNLQEVGLICELKKIDHVHVAFRLTLSPEVEDRDVKPGELLQPQPGQPTQSAENLDDDRKMDSWADEYEELQNPSPQYPSTSELSLSSTDSTEASKTPNLTELEAQFLGSLQTTQTETGKEPHNPIEDIKLILKSQGFLWVHTPMSRTLYKQWLSFSTLPQIEQLAKQIAEMDETQRTPMALDKELRGLNKPKSSGRGKVAL